MKCEVSTYQFNKAIAKLEKVNTKKLTLPILESILITADADQQTLTLSRTNLSTTVNIKLDITVIEPGEILLPDTTTKLISKIKDDYILISDESITAGKKNLKFVGADIEQYPTVESNINEQQFQVTEKELYRMLEVKYACAKDETRPILTGICFDNNRTIALDAYRLSVRESEQYNSRLNKVVVSKDLYETLYKLLDKKSDSIVTVYTDINPDDVRNEYNNVVNIHKMRFQFNDIEIIGKTIEGDFINYKQIIPEDFATKVTVNNIKQLNDELSFANELKTEKTLLVRLTMNENESLKLHADNCYNSVDSEVDADVEGKSIQMAFNNQFLVEALKYYDDKVIMKTMTNISPMIVTADDKNLELILPVRMMQKTESAA
jgi:DNA polymerase-3 subunit beta